MENSEAAESPGRRSPLVRFALIAGFLAWLAYLLLQTGDLYDEAEHGHAAWLMSQGLKPLDDFFQHHQPVLWDLLRVYFAAGFGGAWVLLWGRIIVVACLAATTLALLGLGRRWSDPAGRSRFPGIAGVLYLITLSWVMPSFLVTRPETLSLALFTGALLARECSAKKVARGSLGWSLWAGLLLGGAVYTSPRFLLLGGFFLLLGDAHRGWRVSDGRRFGLLALGVVLFVAGYTVVRGYPLEKVLFNIRFSAFLQSVGDGPRGERLPILGHLAVAALAVVGLYLGARPERRRRILILGLYTITLIGISDGAAGLFAYPQAYTAAFVAVAVTLSYAESQLQWPLQRSTLRGVVMAGAALVLCLVEGAAFKSFPRFKFLDSIRARDAIGLALQSSDKALVFSKHSPITVLDASYYGTPLGDARDRLCRTVEAFKSVRSLPPCDYARTIFEQKPMLIDLDIQNAMSPDQLPIAQTDLNAHYRMLPEDVRQAYWPFLNGLILRVR